MILYTTIKKNKKKRKQQSNRKGNTNKSITNSTMCLLYITMFDLGIAKLGYGSVIFRKDSQWFFLVGSCCLYILIYLFHGVMKFLSMLLYIFFINVIIQKEYLFVSPIIIEKILCSAYYLVIAVDMMHYPN